MLEITIPAKEYFDESTYTFFTVNAAKIQLEHSLLSISKWESKWHKPYLGKERKTAEEIMDYIRCMTITQNVNPAVYNNLTANNLKEILDYIEDPMTATTFNEPKENGKASKQIVTSEIIYYWMIVHNIPFECHLFQNGKHGLSTCTQEVETPDPACHEWLKLAKNWLYRLFDYRC